MELRKFDSQKELEKQRRLFVECFPENIGTPVVSKEYYNWKFHSKTGPLHSKEYVAVEDGELIGYYAAIPYYYAYNNTTLKAGMVCDVMTGLKARGKGVFTRLGMYSTEQMADTFDFTTGYPIRDEVIPGHLKAGWEIYFELPLYGRFIRFNSFLKNRKLGVLSFAANGIHGLNLRITKTLRHRGSAGYTTETHSESNFYDLEEMSEFYQKWRSEIPIALIKDKEFLKWRLGAPEKEYHAITLKKNGEIVGALIARPVMKEGVPCMGILDLALLAGHHDKSWLLMNELITLSKSLKAELVLIMLSQTWYKKYKLRSSLFLKTPFSFKLIIKQLNKKINNTVLKVEENWHLTWIDSDDL